MDYVIQIYISQDRQDMLDFCLPSLLSTNASKIYIYTEKGDTLKIPDHERVRVVRFFENQTYYAIKDSRKLPSLIHLFEEIGEEFVYQCDVDVLTVKDVGAVFENVFDIAVPVYHPDDNCDIVQTPHNLKNIPLGSLWIKNNPRTMALLKLWEARQQDLVKKGDPSSKVMKTGVAFAHNWIAFRDILVEKAYDPQLKIMFLNRLIFNSFTMSPKQHDRNKWLSQLRNVKDRVLVLHYPQNQFRDKKFVEQSLKALE
jgi:hypothetical protein